MTGRTYEAWLVLFVDHCRYHRCGQQSEIKWCVRIFSRLPF